jgi:ABC-type nickel/cobalt efflux system permease component RcnA
LIGDGPAVGRSIGLPTEESLKALVAAPELSLSFILGAFLVAMVWGAAHALTPGHGKAIVGAYLVGMRGNAWHAIYLGLTVTVTHTMGVFMLGLAATLAASHVPPEKLYPWLGILSGMIVFILGAVMFANRIKSFQYNVSAHKHHHHGHDHSIGHIHDHRHDHPHDHENHHHHTDHLHRGHPAGFHQHHDHHASNVDHHLHLLHHPDHDDDHTHDHSHGHRHHHHGGQRHSHLPPGADGSPVTWRSLLTLGISGGLLPCPSALVLLLTAIALHRIGFGLALVAAFSLGLAGVLTVVGLLFIKGSRLIDRSPSFAAVGRWLPATSALAVCLLGGGITWGAISTIMGV